MLPLKAKISISRYKHCVFMPARGLVMTGDKGENHVRFTLLCNFDSLSVDIDSYFRTCRATNSKRMLPTARKLNVNVMFLTCPSPNG
jgi:hypothetical protein